MSTGRRWPIGRGRIGQRLLAVLAIAALTMGCVADTSSVTNPKRPDTVRAETPSQPSPAPATPAAPAATPVPTPRSEPYIAPAPAIAAISAAASRAAALNVPILYYHRVQALSKTYSTESAARREQFATYDVLPVAFAAQLDWLVANGYTTILPRDLAAHWDRGAPLPARPVIISFDDGSHDWVKTVLPMLQARGMVAEFYLTLDAVEFGNLTWKEARRLVAAGNGIGAHDVHHHQLTAFGNGRARTPEATMWAEVSEARRIIGVHVGIFPDSMAYVGGGYDGLLEGLVRNAGYTTARTINRGVEQDPALRFRLRVVRIGVHDDVADFLHGTLVPGLPTFAARMRGVPDK
jgi:peptidoglycan/xylan/chitin deacetylase (PgdA/CDA1 family)